MNIVIKRLYKKSDYTIGDLYINNQWFCNTLEDVDRGLKNSDPLSTILQNKRFGNTAMPTGTYEITLDEVSPKFSKIEKYKTIQGKLPRLQDVPGFEGILIHIGNTNKDTEGCILVGKNKIKGRVCESTDTFFKMYKTLQTANNKGEKITLTIE